MNRTLPKNEREAVGRRETVGLGLLFGAMYFIQGIGEPSEGLIAQPVLSLLKSWEFGDAQIARFAALISLPWAIKPLYGLLSDFLPLAGYRRKGYLLLTSGAATAGLAVLTLVDLPTGALSALLLLLLVPAVGIAFCDVEIDALMVEKGQPRGITGLLQSIQWAAMYAAMILTGCLGGYLSGRHLQRWAFGICAAACGVSFLLALLLVKEEPRPIAGSFRHTAKSLGKTLRSPAVLCVGSFLFLWNFNPFSTAVLYLYQTEHLGFSEQFYGNTVAILAAASIAACISYGFYCRRVPFHHLVHWSIVLGILATIAYWAVWDAASAVIVTLAVGFTYMTASLIQLDLAARVCSPETAGTAFALLMALQNIGMSSSIAVGGWLYGAGAEQWGARTSFNLLVGIGALTTAGCWLLVPWLRRQAAAFSPPRGEAAGDAAENAG